MKILVVDDERANRDICSRLLALAGYEVACAADGDEAVGLLAQDFDIVLTDLNMPGAVTGNQLTRRVRASGTADVLIMTGNPQLETAVQALRDGAYDYLYKPFTQELLLHAVQRCADRRRLSKELAREKALRAELARTTRLRETLGQFATPEVARYTLDHPDDYWRRGELRTVTMLFADVRGFTPFAGRVPPDEVVRTLNEVFERVIEAVRGEGGILNKFVGDGLMALFGAPAPMEDQACAAARAALRARAAIEELARDRQSRGLEALRLGWGINTGEVVAGCVGTRERTEYTVIGHAVNMAARLESAAAAGQILLGPETARLLRDGFQLKEEGSLRLKGVPHPVPMAQLAGEKEDLLAQCVMASDARQKDLNRPSPSFGPPRACS